MLRAAFLLTLCACGIQEIGGGAGLDLPLLDIVYECRVTDRDHRSGDNSGTYEWCYDSGAEELAQQIAAAGIGDAVCHPTPRHAGPCWYRCPGGRGCNAIHGCFCWEGE